MRAAKRYRIISLGILIALLQPILWVLAINYNFLGLFGAMPDLSTLDHPAVASEIYTADGVLMGRMYKQNRIYTPQQEISEQTKNALLAAYDQNLHEPIMQMTYELQVEWNRRGALKGFWPLNLLANRTKKWLIESKILMKYSKAEIIQMYLNLAYFGHNCYGIRAASEAFFDKHPHALNPAESSLLIGVFRTPARYNPVSKPQEASKYRNIILKKMQKYNYISAKECEKYLRSPLQLTNNKEIKDGLAPHFKAELEKLLMGWAKNKGYDLYTDGLKIYTTIDSRMQTLAEEAVLEVMAEKQALFYKRWQGKNPWIDNSNAEIPNYIESESKRSVHYQAFKARFKDQPEKIEAEMNRPIPMRVYTLKNNQYVEIDTLISPMDSIRHYKHFLQAGFMVMESVTGNIKAWVGNLNHRYFPTDRVRMSKRPGGSLLDPVIYMAALENAYLPCQKIGADQVSLKQVFNFPELHFRTKIEFLRRLGLETVQEYSTKIGIPLLDSSLYIGQNRVSLYNVLPGYCTFANAGSFNYPFFIKYIDDRFGNRINKFKPHGKHVIDEELAYQMILLMSESTKSGGSAIAIHAYGKNRENNVGWQNEVAALPATILYSSDAWFVGITPSLAAAAWVGGDTKANRFTSLADAHGSVLALPIWGKFFEKIYSDPVLINKYPKGTFKKPENSSLDWDCVNK